MRTSRLVLALAAAAAFAAPCHADEIVSRAKFTATEAELHDLALQALTKRKYNVESDTPTLLLGELDKSRVEIAISAESLVIRWKGSPGKHEYWLRNLKTDILWGLAE
jgi:hypothetical protein